MNVKKLFILLYVLLNSLLLYGKNNIGVCGFPIFLSRQKIIDSFLVRVENETDIVKQNNIINEVVGNFGYIGIENFVRYKAKTVAKILRRLLPTDDFYTKFKAIYGFGNVGDKSDLTLIRKYLKDKNLLIKDMAIRAYYNLGDEGSINFLNDRLSKERNIYIKSSIKYAIDCLKGRKKLTFPDFKYGISESKPRKYIYYKSGDKIENYKEVYSSIFLPDKDYPEADDFLPPIIDYTNELIFKGKRVSFRVGEKIVHVGDDCGWFREGSSVYAVANGIVRLVHHSPDWGFLVVIEHRLKDGENICSVYGHLSRNIRLRAGEIVKMGEKIGEIGLSYSVDNGGYGAHLHFAISKGPWLKPDINMGRNLKIISGGKEIDKVKKYKFTKNGIEITYENGMKVSISQKGGNLNNQLFWLKGYQFAKDVERNWYDPYQFLKEHSSYFSGNK